MCEAHQRAYWREADRKKKAGKKAGKKASDKSGVIVAVSDRPRQPVSELNQRRAFIVNQSRKSGAAVCRVEGCTRPCAMKRTADGMVAYELCQKHLDAFIRGDLLPKRVRQEQVPAPPPVAPGVKTDGVTTDVCPTCHRERLMAGLWATHFNVWCQTCTPLVVARSKAS